MYFTINYNSRNIRMQRPLFKQLLLIVLLLIYISEAQSSLLGRTFGKISGISSDLLDLPSSLISKTSFKNGLGAAVSVRIGSPTKKRTVNEVSELLSSTMEDWTTCGLLQKYGYDCERHNVTTGDGYILNMFRVLCPKANIPKSKSLPVVFLMHGLLVSSSIWTLSKDHSLAMTLCDSGYDVWLGNARGSEYSLGHVYLNNSDPNYFMFSWPEIAMIDVPTMINYTITYTKQNKVSYVGHSQGSTVFLVLASLNPKLADNIISSAHLLAPVAFATNIGGLLAEFTPLFGVPDPNSSFVEVELSANLLALTESLKGQKYCTNTKLPQRICQEVLYMIFGESPLASPSAVSDMLHVLPSSASARQLKHFLQEKVTSDFRFYDYGRTINVAKYAFEEPQQFPVANIIAPTFLYYSDKDIICAESDVKRLMSLMNPSAIKGSHFLSGFYHTDYYNAENVTSLLYSVIINNIKKIQYEEK